MNKTPIYIIIALTVLLTIGFLVFGTQTTVDTPATETETSSQEETATIKL